MTLSPALSQGRGRKAHARKPRRFKIPRLRKIRAKVRAPRIGARFGRRTDRFAHGDQAVEVEPVMPGQIVAKVFAGDAGFAKPRAQFLEATARARQALRVAKDADVVPHEVVERLANRLDVAGSLADRAAR